MPRAPGSPTIKDHSTAVDAPFDPATLDELRRTGTRELGTEEPSRQESGSPRTPPRESGPQPARGTALESMQAMVEREEIRGYVLRLGKAAYAGVILWPLCAALDWLMVTYVQETAILNYLVPRVASWLVVIAAMLVATRSRQPSWRLLMFVDMFSWGSVSLALSVMCLWSGGVYSPYVVGIVGLVGLRGTYAALHWKRALLPVAIGVFAYPAVMLGAVLLHHPSAAPLLGARGLSVFIVEFTTTLMAAIYSIAGGHGVWSLQRQLCEARSIGRYRLVRRIGRGGMGEVWAAKHASMQRLVALKVLRGEKSRDPVALRRFEREVQATAELTHPNTVRVFDYGATDDGLWYYAMELLQGEDLATLIERIGPLEEARCISIMLQVCGALAEAHALGIVHRDIKPENVFLCSAGGVSDFVKVLDFGIAKRDERFEDTRLTQENRVLGTPEYISPEVALGRPADARSDVYAMGALFYFLLAGTAPFTDAGAAALLVAHATQRPEPPSARRGKPLSGRIESLVLRCLEKSPEARYADASELLRAIETLTTL